MRTYTVSSGDTLWAIASRLSAQGVAGSTAELVRQLARQNGLANPNLLRVGQRLQLPGATDGFQPPAAPAPAQLDGTVTGFGRGATGPHVAEVQAALKRLGLYHANVGGNFGPKTEEALRAFQQANGLVADGRATPETVAALTKAAGAAPVAPTTPSGPTPAGIAGMLDWARGRLGAPYAAVNPFRFGDVPWDGGAHRSVNGSGTVWQYPRGTQVFDCSGFVVAAYRQLGIDLAAKGLYSSGTIHSNSNGYLQNVDVNQLRPGDLITFKPRNGIGHVAIYLGDGQIIQSSGGKGVNIASLDWGNIQSVRRVPV